MADSRPDAGLHRRGARLLVFPKRPSSREFFDAQVDATRRAL